MAHFAELDDSNKVLRVIVVGNEFVPDPAPDNEQAGIDFIANVVGLGGRWIQTSYSGSFRRRYAGVGMTYSVEHDAFLLSQPFDSWTQDDNGEWQAPVKYPTDGQQYLWNENKKSWEVDNLWGKLGSQ